MDERDPLGHFRRRFDLPEALIYLDGNSLGPLLKHTPDRLLAMVEQEWGKGLIGSWNAAGWIEAPTRIGGQIAGLVGAGADEVLVADSISVNLFKLLSGALRLRPERGKIVSQAGNFPTDLYIAQGVVDLLGAGHRLAYVDAADEAEIITAIDEDTALVMLTQVDYRSGRMLDMARVTAAAHERGALMLWDLAHSAGAVPVDLSAAGADLAVGCTYKYLNGGPGAPAFLYVRRDLQESLPSTISGWLGHAAPFAFERDYRPAPGVLRHLCGTPPIVAMAALESAMEVWREVSMAALRAKSLAQSDLFMGLVERALAPHGLKTITPRDPSKRGSQVSFRHPEGYAIIQALIRRGVIGDFREPDVMRFGIAPLYVRYADIWDAVEHLREVLETREWDLDEFKRRAAVT